MNANNLLQVQQRAKAPMPPFFKKLRNAGLALAAISAALLASPVALPLIVTQAAGYITLAGGVIGAVSQLTVQADEGGS